MVKSKSSKQMGEGGSQPSISTTPTRISSPIGDSTKDSHVSASDMQRLRNQVVELQMKLENYEVMFKNRDMTPEYTAFKNETENVLLEIDNKLEPLILEQKRIDDFR
jgi:hypothetical protein